MPRISPRSAARLLLATALLLPGSAQAEHHESDADAGVMMEINAHPSRLDLDDLAAATARDLGIPIVISTDAHSTRGFEVMEYGIFQARRAGLEKQHVANTRTWAQFKKLMR